MLQGIEKIYILSDVAAVTTPHFHGFSARLKESYALIRMESCTKMNEDLQEELIETVRKFASLWDVTSKSLKDNKAKEHVKRLP